MGETVQFKEATASQSDGGDSFTLHLDDNAQENCLKNANPSVFIESKI
jgi:hypothetical protein